MRFTAASAFLALATANDQVYASFFKSSLSSSTITQKYGLDISYPIPKRNGWFVSTDLRGGAMGKLKI